jgi:DtxR family Mn-dependent transcriptional regulator
VRRGLSARGLVPHALLPVLPLPFRGGVQVDALGRTPAGGGAGVSVSDARGSRVAAVARDEVLEELWTAREAGTPLTEEALGRTIHAGPGGDWGASVRELVALGFVRVDDALLTLTDAGEREARQIVRRHRLAEVLFHQVLELPMEVTEAEACSLEHVLTPEATAAVCSFLGHPPLCPHGRPIPPGDCCSALSRRVASLICRLADLVPGEMGRVVLVAPRQRERLSQLADLGVTPGAVLSLRQRKPSLVVEVDQTLLALEDEIAEGIYLQPIAVPSRGSPKTGVLQGGQR